ncbi:hypothetical protein [Streptomyces endophytica]|uniref:Uncharacterized protein n=1 Tax=Streptomyces endophytica TaxID=2991496 RepID=A0ABY6PIU5_9ACTN|nr:hypothetical protein [Streptomyces endophytica]UZJ33824.1 hypothetical protein OJ254_30645 [Streptomyces endophytica]
MTVTDVCAEWITARVRGGGAYGVELARATRSADALGIYRRLADSLQQQTGNPICEQLTGLLLGMRDGHRCLGTEAEFTAFLTALRAGQRRERNLLRTLDAHGL